MGEGRGRVDIGISLGDTRRREGERKRITSQGKCEGDASLVRRHHFMFQGTSAYHPCLRSSLFYHPSPPPPLTAGLHLPCSGSHSSPWQHQLRSGQRGRLLQGLRREVQVPFGSGCQPAQVSERERDKEMDIEGVRRGEVGWEGGRERE